MPRVTAAGVLAALAATFVVAVTPIPAAADTQTVSNTTSLTIPVGGANAPSHSPASLYPSPITISGLTGATTKVTVSLNNLTHTISRDVEVLLVAPSGETSIVMADIGNNGAVSGLNLTFDDAAAANAPNTALSSGTYKPTNLTNGATDDVWPAPAPTPGGDPDNPFPASFGVFNGINPNGTWNLYVVDDNTGDAGTLAGGWTLTVETGVSSFPGQIQLGAVEFRGTEGGGVAAVTVNRVAGDDGEVGATFTTGTGTATAGVDYTPVAQTVTFADGDTSETVNIPIADDPSIEGIDELIPITLSAPTGGATLGSPTAGQVRLQDNDARANAFPITIPSTTGASNPYPSNIVVAGAGGVVTDVDVTLTDLSHTHLRDLDVLLVAPNGATTMLLLDAGGGPATPVSNVNLTFSDEAAGSIPSGAVSSGTYKPTQFDDEVPELLPAPAPAGPWGTTLSALDGNSPNGTWSLYVVDDSNGDAGDIGGGWSLTLEAATASAGGPYTTPEGSGVTLSGSTTPDQVGATYEWDVDGDGQYDDATGQNPTVSAATLSAIGLGDGPDSSNVRVRVTTTSSAVITSTATTLTITNVAPTATFTNNGPVTQGNTADVSFSGQSDPSSADTTAGFRYSYDFDDDGDWEVGDGTYAGSSTSASATVPTTVLTAVGTYEVNGRILDKDGGFTDYTTVITVNAPPNSAPVADAGDDQNVDGGDLVVLDGSGSSDPDSGDSITSYSWVQTAGPAVTLTGANTANPSFIAPTGPATLTFELTVSDGDLTDTDTVDVVVNGIPTADAGPDQTVNLGDTVTLDGTGSSDPDVGDDLTYSWEQTGGGTVVTLDDPTAAQPTFTAPEGPDVLAFALTVTDETGATAVDTVLITVNGPPTADAGPDQDAELGDTVTLDGTGSTDPDGHTLLYSWVQTAGPAVTLVGSNTANPSFTAPAGPGVITFQLTVDDQNGRTDTDEVNVSLNDTPIADAGPDQSVNPGTTVTLDGTGSTDPEEDPLLYSWIQTAGPAVTLVGSNTANPTFTAPSSGTLTFELTVTDDEGLTDTDTVDVRINGAPTAVAGPDQLVNLGNTVTLDGTGSTDPDGDTPLRYQWDQTYGPAVTLSPGRFSPTVTFTAPEGPTELRFRLIVRDPQGRFGVDFVHIVVNGPPSANAGPDVLADINQVVTLSGGGSFDPDGDTLKYQWDQTFGPAVTLSNRFAVSPTFTTPSQPAELRFRLIVRDQRGRFDTDFVTVTVSGPPVANAGPDQTVEEGDLVTLDGSGSTSPVRYQWTQTYGPPVVLSSTTAAMPTFTAPDVTTTREVRFRLIVRDGRGRFGTDFVHITVTPDPGP